MLPLKLRLKRILKIYWLIIIFILIFNWIFSCFPRIWQSLPLPLKIKQAEAAGSVISAVESPTYSVSQEQVGGSDAHILVLTNPGNTANYKWQFLTGGLRFFIDRKQGAGWEQLVSQIQTFPQYIKRQGAPSNCVWNPYGLNINTSGGNVLQGFDRQNQGDGSVKMNRTYSTFEEGIAETLTETWIIPSSAEALANNGVKVSYNMTKNRGIVPDGSCQEGTWQMKWELSGVADITADNSNILGDDGKPLKQKYYSNNEFLISVLDFVVQAGDTVHSFSEIATNNKASITFFPSGTTGNRVIDPLVGTTTDAIAIYASWHHNVTYANGYYWAFYYSGTDAVYESSSDGSTWSGTVTDVFSTVDAPGGSGSLKWSMRHIPGTTNRILAVWSDATASVYFRRGTMGSDGTITWDSDDITARNSAATPLFPTVSEDSGGYPYLTWRAVRTAPDPIRPIEESKSSQQNGSSGWDTDDHKFLTLNNTTVRGGVLFDIGSQNMYGMSVEGSSGEMVGNKFTNGVGWDTDTNIVTDTVHTTLDNKNIWSAVKDSDGNIHLVFIDNTSDIQHYKYTVSTASWALVDADIVIGGSTATKLTLAADGNNFYVFYVDTAQALNRIYYKKYNGSSWGAQLTLKDDATAINSSLSAYEFSGNSEIGAIWAEEAGVNDNVIFSKISVSTYNQSAYRWFNNTDSTDVGTALANQDTAATLALAGDAFRLRMLLHVAGAQLNTNEENFKLQFAAKSGGSCGDDESFSDVTGATAIAYKNNTTPADGDNLTDNANDPTHSTDDIVNQDYEEANDFTNSVAAIPVDDDGLWDFALYDNSAPAGTAYCLRAVRASGTVLTTYTVYPQITTASAGSTITFSISDNTIGFGTLSASDDYFATGNGSGSAIETEAHTLTASTNAANGYVITVNGATLTCSACGSATITAIGASNTASSTGSEQFGLRMTATGGSGAVSAPYAASGFAFDTAAFPDEVAASTGASADTIYSVRYVGNIAPNTDIGSYTATLTYTITGQF